VLDELEARSLLSTAKLLAVGAGLAATEGIALSATVATFRDADGNTQSGAYAATIVWGDGATSHGTISADPKKHGTWDVKGTHTFAEERASTQVVVTITDTDGDTATATDPIKVADAALTATATTLADAGTHAFALATVATFTDANPKGAVGDFTATINWGDGTTSAGQVVKDAKTAGQFDVVGSHAYTANPNGVVVATAIKDTGGSQTVSNSKVVAHFSIVGHGASVSATEGKPFSGTVATFTDSNVSAAATAFTATIEWGDGTSSTGKVIANPALHGDEFEVTGAHTYAEEMPKGKITVLIRGNDGTSGQISNPIKVADAAITATALTLVDQQLHNLQNVTVATFRDADPKGALADYSASINWGDGATTIGRVIKDAKVAGQFDVIGSHRYAASALSTATAGYTVTTTIKDVGGSQATARSSIVVAQPVLISVTEGQPFPKGSLKVAAFDSTNPKINLTQFKATVDWGDGLTSTGTIKADSTIKYQYDVSVSGRNPFTDEGAHLLLTTVTGPGGIKMSIPGVVKVGDAPLLNNAATAPTVTISVGGSTTGPIGEFVDTNPLGTAGDFSGTVDWGDGSPAEAAQIAAGAGASVRGPTFDVVNTHTYDTDPGQYTVTASIKDKGGKSITLTETVVVQSQVVVSPPTATEGKALNKVTVASFTAGPHALAGEFTAQIDWGDGQQSTGTVQGSGGRFTVVGSHTYSEESPAGKPFTLTVTVQGIDPKGPVSGHANITVSDAALVVGNTQPALVADPSAPLTGATIASFTDQDPQGTASDYTVSIDWGDGKTSTGTIQPITGNGSGSLPSFNVLGDHNYASQGVYDITVTVKDDGGATLTLYNEAVPPPSLEMSGHYTASGVVAGSPPPGLDDSPGIWMIAQFDPMITEPYTAYTISVDWGDGTTSSPPTFYRPPIGNGGIVGILDDHVYASGGPVGSPQYYTITITITGPGIDPANPLTGTIIEGVIQYN
jgi:hypothetical protein